MQSYGLGLLIVLGLCGHCVLAASKKSSLDLDNAIQLEHNLGTGFTFTPKGHVVVKSARAKGAFFMPASSVSTSDVFRRMEELVEAKKNYVVRAAARPGWPVNDSSSVFSFARACSLVHSRLSERLSFHLSAEGDVISITIRPQRSECLPAGTKEKAPSSFNTTCSLTHPSTGPVPDTASYIQKVQREEEIRQKNPPDNRSFIQKYWMYIVPFLLFIMMSSGGQEGRQGGGGRE